MSAKGQRRERRKAKASGWARQPNPGGKVGHHASADPMVAYVRPPQAAKPKVKKRKSWRQAVASLRRQDIAATLADVWPHG